MIRGEEWRTIPGYEGRYEVSNLGRVRSLLHGDIPRLLKPSLHKDGYPQVHLTRADGQSMTKKVHRLVAAAFYGPCPEGLEVRHLDGNKQDNGVDNLKYGTHSENMLDRTRLGELPLRLECPYGHPYDEANAYHRPNESGRTCRTCHARRCREYRARRRVAAQQVGEVV